MGMNIIVRGVDAITKDDRVEGGWKEPRTIFMSQY